MDRFIDRRLFLKLSGMTLALSVADAAAARRLAPPRRVPERPTGPPRANQLTQPTLLTVFLRGGADGLNLVVPTEPTEYATYQSYRGALQVTTAAMSSAGTLLTDAGGADAGWGLHPSAAPIVPLWQAGSLAVFPDIHYENGSRSHFDSQQFYESGTPWNKLTPDGWANRHLSSSGSGDPLLRAISFDTQTPFSMKGPYPTLTFSSLQDLSASGNLARNGRYLDTQEAVYPLAEGGPRAYDRDVAVAGQSLVGAIRWIQDTALPNPSVTYPETGPYGYFGTRLKDLAKLIKSDAFSIEMAEIDLYGWDTHNGQDTYFPNLVGALASGLRAFHDDVGDQFMQNIVIFVVSEFGRTARANGSAGTDHGSATMAFVLGHPSRVLGRRVVTRWFGLDDLREDRDLKHSYDFRDVVFEIASRHLGNSSPTLFPAYTPTPIGFLA